MTTTLTEALHPGTFIIAEEEMNHCRDAVQIALSQTLVTGQVLGRTALITGVTSSAAADAGNTGNGTITLDVTAPVAAGAKNGIYRVVNNLVAANSGEFEVFDPDGVEIGRVLVGATFNNQIKFVVADGATDFAIGDAFSVTVGIERSDFDYLALDLTAVTGAQNPAGILVGGITTDGTTKKKAAALVRGPAQVMGASLTWPAGITAAQKADQIVKLEALGIIIR
jgi:hypothetical protein